MKIEVKNFFKNKICPALTPSVRFYLVLVVSLCVSWIMFVHETDIQASNLLFDFFHCLGDVLVIMLPFWFVSRKWRIVPLVLLWVLSLFLIGDIIYFRFCHDVLSPISISKTCNVHEELTDSIFGMLLHVGDLKYLIFPAIATFAFCRLRPINQRFSRKVKIWMSVVAVALFGFGRLFDSSSAPTDTNRELVNGRVTVLSKEVLQLKRGMLGYAVHSVDVLKYWLMFHQDLSEAERAEITKFIDDVPFNRSAYDFTQNKYKNLIIVLVESFNGSCVNREVNGVEITPSLNRLITEPGTIYSTDVVSQIRDGISSDGQLLIETGMLPSINGSASILAGNSNTFPSLPGYFPGYDCRAVFASGAQLWHEGRTHGHYGYDVICRKDYKPRVELLGADGAMFEAGAKIIESDTTQRLLLTMLTASMHVPFVDDHAPEVPEWSDLPEDLRNYYTVTHYFDRELGVFVNFLKESGVLERSVLIVTSDHCQMATSGGEYEPAFFGAFNTGVTLRLEQPVGQVNLYPAILEIMDRLPESGYRGMGRSALDPELKGAVGGYGMPHGEVDADMYRAFEVSDRMIRGDYFAKP